MANRRRTPPEPSATEPDAGGTGEPAHPGTSSILVQRKPLRRFTLWFAFATGAFVLIQGSSGILLGNQIQAIEFANTFLGANAGVDLVQLTQLRDAIAAGTAQATAVQTEHLALLAQFESARANGLAVVVSLATLATMFTQPIVGVFSDRTRSRFGRRAPWVLGGAIIGSLALLGLRFAPTVTLVALLFIVVQAAYAAAQGPMQTAVADRVPQNKLGAVSSMAGLGNFAGGIVGAIVAGAAFASLGLNVWLVWAALIVVFVVVFLLRNRDRSSLDLAVAPFRWGAFFAGFVVPLRSKDFRWVWIARVLIVFGFSVSTALGLFMLQSYVRPGLSLEDATELAPLLAIAGVPFTLVAVIFAGRLSDKLGRRKPFVILSGVLMAVSMLVPLISPSVPALFIQAVLASLAFGIFLPVDQALFIDVLPDAHSAGRDLGIALVATALGAALGPVLAAQVVAITGGYHFVWIAAFVLTASASLAILPVKGAR